MFVKIHRLEKSLRTSFRDRFIILVVFYEFCLLLVVEVVLPLVLYCVCDGFRWDLL